MKDSANFIKTNSNKKIAAVFFDLDGTLLDTAEDLLTALNFILIKEGHAPITINELIPLISKGSRNIIKNIIKLNITKERLQELRDAFINAYINFGHQYTKMFPGINEVINNLNLHDIPWGIITNKTIKLTSPVISLFKLEELNCRTVVCADTTNNPKPHPDPMLKACNDVNVDPKDCIFIGDARTDVEAGKAVKMLTVTAAYGYIPKDEDIASWKADFIIQSPLELLSLFNTK